MNFPTFILVLVGVLLNAGAQLLLKAGTNRLGRIDIHGLSSLLETLFSVGTQPHILGGLTAYVFSVGLWIVALSRVEVSVAYPMLSIGYVVNAAAAWYLFGEAVSPMRLAGIGVIIIGVVLVGRS